MSEFKGTRGGVVLGDEKYYNGNKAYEIWHGNDGECVAEVVHKIEDANLIVDAFKVRQQINCELSELLEQRNEMFTKEEVIQLIEKRDSHHRNTHSLGGWKSPKEWFEWIITIKK